MKLLVFAASHRKQSINRKLAALTAKIAQGHDVDIIFPEYADFDMPIYDDETFDNEALPDAAKYFVELLTRIDGIIISSPEYNWSFPGSLKNIIDWASVATPNPFMGKTALLLSASPSLRGGSHGLIHLKVPLQALGVFVYPGIFALGLAQHAFDDNGNLSEPKLQEELQYMVADFIITTSMHAGSLGSRALNKLF